MKQYRVRFLIRHYTTTTKKCEIWWILFEYMRSMKKHLGIYFNLLFYRFVRWNCFYILYVLLRDDKFRKLQLYELFSIVPLLSTFAVKLSWIKSLEWGEINLKTWIRNFVWKMKRPTGLLHTNASLLRITMNESYVDDTSVSLQLQNIWNFTTSKTYVTYMSWNLWRIWIENIDGSYPLTNHGRYNSVRKWGLERNILEVLFTIRASWKYI